MKPVYVRSEMNPQFVNIVTPVDVVIKVEFVLEMEGRQCKAYLCIPYGTVEPIKEKLYSAFSADRDELDLKWLDRMKDRLREIPVEVKGVLGSATLDVDRVVSLKENDLIILDRRVDEDIDILVENHLKFKGNFGIFRGSYALKVETVL
jgi:flagellar motor switch protein FliM